MAKSAKPFSATYTAVDGASKKGEWATIEGLAAFVTKWAGNFGHGGVAVSDDGIGRVAYRGATAEQLEALTAPAATPPAANPFAALGARPEQAAKPVEKPAAVALRGGIAVSSVKLHNVAVYHTKAEHNLGWWKIITDKATKEQAASVKELVEAKVPARFVGYCIRRGYLVAA